MKEKWCFIVGVLILIVLIGGCTTQDLEVKSEVKICTNSCKSNEIRTAYPDCKCTPREPELVECDSCEQMIFSMLGICTTRIGRMIEVKYANSSMKIVKDKCLHDMIFRINSTVVFVCGKGTTCYDSYIRVIENGTLKGNLSCVIENNTQYVYLEVTPGPPAPIRPNFTAPGYVYTLANNALYKLNPDFTYVSQFGDRYESSKNNSGLNFPMGVDVDKNGNVYVFDHGNDRIVKLNSNLKFEDSYYPAETNGQCTTPLAVDENGYIYIADFSFATKKFPSVIKLNLDLSLNSEFKNQSSLLFQDKFFGPVGVAVDKSGYVYVADESGRRIIKLTSDLKYVSTFNLNGQTLGIKVNSKGYIYVLNLTTLIRIEPDFIHSMKTNYSANNIEIDKNDYIYLITYDTLTILNPDLTINSKFEDMPYLGTMAIGE